MCKCWVCGAPIADNETLYPLPVYDLKPDERQYSVMGRVMCWNCFSTLVSGTNVAIFLLRHESLQRDRGESAAPKNCEIGTADEQLHRFKEEWEKANRTPAERTNLHLASQFARWAQTPYKEGDANAQ